MSVNEKMTAIADAIREKTGDTAKLSLDGMAETIRKLPDPIVNTVTGNPIALSDSSALKLRGLTLYGKTTQDGTPTPEAPVELVSAGDGGILGVTVTGKNLLNLPQVIEVTPEGSHYDLFTGTVSAGASIPTDMINQLPKLNAGVTYYFSCNISGGAGTTDLNLFKVADDGITSWGNVVGKATGAFTPSEDMRITIRLSGRYTYNVENFQLEKGTVATAYEPYKEPQTLTVSTPNGLPGIPVTSGGNYTDSTGQQWVCDEVDFARGVYVQRVTTIVFDGSDDEGWTRDGPTGTGLHRVVNTQYASTIKPSATQDIRANAICSSFLLFTATNTWYCNDDECSIDIRGTIRFVRPEFTSESTLVADWKSYLQEKPITMVAELATPIETALSAEELSAYAALHTNYPNTTILNDGGAGMEAQYVADTKRYIDNKIAALASAIVNN